MRNHKGKSFGHFSNVNWSTLQVLEGRPQYVEMAGNLIPITKSGDQLYISFKAFRENRLPCLVKIRDRDQEPAARVAFMKEPKVVRGELPQTPICNLNISLPDMSTVRLIYLDLHQFCRDEISGINGMMCIWYVLVFGAGMVNVLKNLTVIHCFILF